MALSVVKDKSGMDTFEDIQNPMELLKVEKFVASLLYNKDSAYYMWLRSQYIGKIDHLIALLDEDTSN